MFSLFASKKMRGFFGCFNNLNKNASTGKIGNGFLLFLMFRLCTSLLSYLAGE